VAGELCTTRLGEDVDTTVADAVVLRRKRILVDVDLEDGRLRRKLAAGEAVDIDLSAIGAGRRACKGASISLPLRMVEFAFSSELRLSPAACVVTVTCSCSAATLSERFS
jgi:hypothetical protein